MQVLEEDNLSNIKALISLLEGVWMLYTVLCILYLCGKMWYSPCAKSDESISRVDQKNATTLFYAKHLSFFFKQVLH